MKNVDFFLWRIAASIRNDQYMNLLVKREAFIS